MLENSSEVRFGNGEYQNTALFKSNITTSNVRTNNINAKIKDLSLEVNQIQEVLVNKTINQNELQNITSQKDGIVKELNKIDNEIKSQRDNLTNYLTTTEHDLTTIYEKQIDVLVATEISFNELYKADKTMLSALQNNIINKQGLMNEQINLLKKILGYIKNSDQVGEDIDGLLVHNNGQNIFNAVFINKLQTAADQINISQQTRKQVQYQLDKYNNNNINVNITEKELDLIKSNILLITEHLKQFDALHQELQKISDKNAHFKIEQLNVFLPMQEQLKKYLDTNAIIVRKMLDGAKSILVELLAKEDEFDGTHQNLLRMYSEDIEGYFKKLENLLSKEDLSIKCQNFIEFRAQFNGFLSGVIKSIFNIFLPDINIIIKKMDKFDKKNNIFAVNDSIINFTNYLIYLHGNGQDDATLFINLYEYLYQFCTIERDKEGTIIHKSKQTLLQQKAKIIEDMLSATLNTQNFTTNNGWGFNKGKTGLTSLTNIFNRLSTFNGWDYTKFTEKAKPTLNPDNNEIDYSKLF